MIQKKLNVITRTALAGLFFAITLGACVEKTGTCESTYENWQGYTLYTCEENVEEYLCEGSGDHMWEGSSCNDLGYSHYNPDNENWQYNSGNNGIPGDHGAWGDGTGTGGSGGGGGTGSCDASGYDGPEFDIQVDSQCKAAYYYECIGNSQGVAAACAIYAQWKQDNPDIPSCPYCD